MSESLPKPLLVRRSCDACLKRKVRCDSGRPCQRCQSRQEECHYGTITRRPPRNTQRRKRTELAQLRQHQQGSEGGLVAITTTTLPPAVGGLVVTTATLRSVAAPFTVGSSSLAEEATVLPLSAESWVSYDSSNYHQYQPPLPCTTALPPATTTATLPLSTGPGRSPHIPRHGSPQPQEITRILATLNQYFPHPADQPPLVDPAWTGPLAGCMPTPLSPSVTAEYGTLQKLSVFFEGLSLESHTLCQERVLVEALHRLMYLLNQYAPDHITSVLDLGADPLGIPSTTENAPSSAVGAPEKGSGPFLRAIPLLEQRPALLENLMSDITHNPLQHQLLYLLTQRPKLRGLPWELRSTEQDLYHPEVIIPLCALYTAICYGPQSTFMFNRFLARLRQNRVSALLLNAMLAVASPFSSTAANLETPRHQAGRYYAQRTKYLILTSHYISPEAITNFCIGSLVFFNAREMLVISEILGMTMRKVIEAGYHQIDLDTRRPSGSPEFSDPTPLVDHPPHLSHPPALSSPSSSSLASSSPSNLVRYGGNSPLSISSSVSPVLFLASGSSSTEHPSNSRALALRSDIKYLARNIIRQIFWVVYCGQTMSNLALGLNPGIDADIICTLPPDEDFLTSVLRSDGTDPCPCMPFAHFDYPFGIPSAIQLYRLMNTLNEYRAGQRVGRVVTQARHEDLDHQFRQWEKTLPPECTLAYIQLAFPGSPPSLPANPPQWVRHLLSLHCNYYMLRICLNTPSPYATPDCFNPFTRPDTHPANWHTAEQMSRNILPVLDVIDFKYVPISMYAYLYGPAHIYLYDLLHGPAQRKAYARYRVQDYMNRLKICADYFQVAEVMFKNFQAAFDAALKAIGADSAGSATLAAVDPFNL
ncbi:hypothetical protein H4R33_004679 [Dimargaris cristalligena]|nr:hypothetical protein H4R33_004679 [Dimargaris cristalligena]